MASIPGVKLHTPQAFISTLAPRIRTFGNSLMVPVFPQANTILPARTTKRGTTAVNYAEDGFDDDDFDDSEGPRRPTGLRSLRREDTNPDKTAQSSQIGKEVTTPVEVQGIWRDWMGKPKRSLTYRQTETQANLPLNLIPIRIDLEIQPFKPDAALPTPHNAQDFGIDGTLPAYRIPDLTPQYRVKDTFLWNLHEALVTPDHFAKNFVDELDFPMEKKSVLIQQIATQIRTQLEEYAGVALHPLFHPTISTPVAAAAAPPPPPPPPVVVARGATPVTALATPTSLGNGTPNGAVSLPNGITATAVAVPQADDIHNPDDTYRCIISLNINIMNKLYSDKFEWSLLHPPGFAEVFARQTCADLGLTAEWVPTMAHAIYEAVLRLKKEACENGGLVGYGEIDNDAAEGVEAGWRYEPERLADEWEPKVEILSKEEIDRREGDRERQIRRQRRETARFSSTANMVGGIPQSDFFANPETLDQPMGRGERSKKKRRFRSLSPTGRETPDVAGYGGGGGLQEWERHTFRCSHCLVWGSAVWAVRDGPAGPRTLCHNCGFMYERDKKLPLWCKALFLHERPYGQRS